MKIANAKGEDHILVYETTTPLVFGSNVHISAMLTTITSEISFVRVCDLSVVYIQLFVSISFAVLFEPIFSFLIFLPRQSG